MINSVRNTVLSIVNKDNRGYISPEEFNLYSKQAQIEIYEKLFYDYSIALAKQNAGLHGSGYSDIVFKLGEIIDRFLTPTVLHYNGTTQKFYVPGEAPTPTFPVEAKSYRIEKIYYNNAVEIEQVPISLVRTLLNSSTTTPSLLFPIYTLDTQGIRIYPATIITNVNVVYLRYPADPKWTYTTLSAGEPLFNQGATDYQDFELPLNEEYNLIIKILGYAGITVREAEVAQAAKSDEVQNNQEKA